MSGRLVKRYSLAFKRQVVEALESGRFASMKAAARHYGITGEPTIKRWVKQFGKNHLLAKVVRVESVGEADELAALRRKVAQLEKALGQTQAQSLLNGEYLRLACGRLGEDVEAFKKKSDGKLSTESSSG